MFNESINSTFQLHEVDIFGMNDTLTPPELYCDVVCLMYDASHSRSFEYIARLFLVSLSYFSIYLNITISFCYAVFFFNA